MRQTLRNKNNGSGNTVPNLNFSSLKSRNKNVTNHVFSPKNSNEMSKLRAGNFSI